MKTGRNEACPCGSGIKYKKCCMEKDRESESQSGAGPSFAGGTMDELKDLLQGHSFQSIDEVNAFLQQHMAQRNEAPIDDFHGLSSEQMHRVLYFPFATPELVTFPSRLDVQVDAPIMALFKLLVDAIGESGLKATATGNLPRNVCREAARAFFGEQYEHQYRFGEVRTEPDFRELNITRLVAEMAGLIRKYKGRFILSKECRKLLAEPVQGGIYPRLFQTYVSEFNWGYADRYQEIPFIQQSFLFTLYLLKRYGGEWNSNTFYEEHFLRAFPNVVSEVTDTLYWTSDKIVRRCFSLRALERFARFMGLAELDPPVRDFMADEYNVRKLPLLDQVVQFHL